MKNFALLIFLFIATFTFGQVNIPNVNFKAKLLQASPDNQIAFGTNSFIKIDQNDDGEIQVGEALVVTELRVNYSQINNLQGLEAFTNLKYLDCSQNSISSLNVATLLSLENLKAGQNNGLTSIDLTQNSNLKKLDLDNDNLVTINLSNNINLTDLTIRSNNLASLNLASNPNLQNVNCFNNDITSIVLNGNNALTYLNCGSNNLTTINTSQCLNLQELRCGQNQIAALNVAQNTSLQKLICGSNSLTALNVSNNSNLTELVCSLNQLTAVNLSQNQNLIGFDCSSNPLSNLDLSSCPNLSILSCMDSQLTFLNVSQNTNLTVLNCSYNQINNLDLSQNAELLNLDCGNNPITSLDISNNFKLNNINCVNTQVTHLFLKNGLAKTYNFSNNALLEYICTDEFQVAELQQALGIAVRVSSYCSALPGGQYNTISGSMYFDSLENGCEATDVSFPFMKLKIQNGTNTEATFSNNLSDYNFYTSTGEVYLFPAVEEMDRFNFSPIDTTVNFVGNDETFTQDFCITANGIHPDVEIVIAPLVPTQSGAEAIYKVVYKNKGNQILSGAIELTFDNNKLQLINASIPPTSQNLGVLNWDYQNLMPFENRSFELIFDVNPALIVGNEVIVNGSISSLTGDDLPVDNTFAYKQTVVDTFLPNSITCLQGDIIPTAIIGNYIHYNINFENTGTSSANNVVLTFEIDPTKLDIETLQILNSSHDIYAKVAGNRIEIFIQNTAVDTGGHGNVLLKIKSHENLLEDDALANQVNVYFNYDAPIETNMAYSIFQTMGSDHFEADESIVVFPNPTHSILNIKCDNTIKTVELFDVQGRLLQTQIVEKPTTSLHLSDKAKGIYFIKITSENGVKVEKISKE